MKLKKHIEYLPLDLQIKARELLSIAREVDLEIEVIKTAEHLLYQDNNIDALQALNCALYEWDI
jgi:hypothetical protein